jgi:Xaa-Pro aminopeptidase
MVDVSYKPVGLNRNRLTELIRARGLDGIFFSSPENVFYTTGYPCLPTSGNPIIYSLRNQLPFLSYAGNDDSLSLLCWAQATMGVEYATEDIRSYFMYDMALDEISSFIQEKCIPGCHLGVDSTFPFFLSDLIQKNASSVSFQNVDDLIHELQLIKTPLEIDRIRKATDIVDHTVLELAEILHPGMSRLELIQEAKTRMLRNGAYGVDHVTVAFGPANPEVALDEQIEPNQIVTLDLGAVYEGYVSDNRRLVYTGLITENISELHKKMCWIVAEMGKELKPGKTFGELHARAFELHAQAGIDPMFLHVGHSIGLHVDEHWIMADDPTLVQRGMVLNIELYSLSDAAVMVGDEETFVVTDGEPEKLSLLPVDIIEKDIYSNK